MSGNKAYVKLPYRALVSGHSIDPDTGFCRTLESHPEEFKVNLLGKISVPTGRSVTLEPDPIMAKRGAKSRSVQDTELLLVFQDLITKKVFYWEGTRAYSENVRLNNHFSIEKEITYSHWPNELIQLNRDNLKMFYFYVYAFGMAYVLDDAQYVKVKNQKKKLVDALKEMAGDA